MKIGIVTIIDNTNYGNRLQNYALQELLKTMGYHVITLKNEKFRDLNYIKAKTKKERIKQILQTIPFLFFITRLKKKIFPTKTTEDLEEHSSLKGTRIERFYNFTQQHILEAKEVLRYYDIPRGIGGRYDYFIAGSDQIWNPNHYRGNRIDFLQFAPKHKRIAYAASFGISEIPDSHKEQFKKYLNDMYYISVRETSGKKIVKDLTDRETDVFLDPTMMLSVDDWSKLGKKPECNLPDRYLVTFFLGEKTSEYNEWIETFAKKIDCDIIELNDMKFPELYVLDPFEFLYVLHHSSWIITDSFHGCVFSILFQKQFNVYRRQDKEQDMFSRITTLLEKFHMQQRIIEQFTDYDEIIRDDQFFRTEEILKSEREKIKKKMRTVFEKSM